MSNGEQRRLILSRREALRLGLLGAAGAAALVGGNGLSALGAPAAPPGGTKAKAKAVIQIWLWGGAAHLDTFDPKPEAGNDYCGPFTKPVETNVKGIRICELLPLLAKQADKYSILRGTTHGQNGHETASYLVQTGRMPGSGQVFPAVGAVVSLFKGYDAGYTGLIPPYIVLTDLQGRFSESGFLPSKCKPFATGGDPGQSRFVVEGVVAQGISDKRQKDRRELMGQLDTLGRALKSDERVEASRKCENQAYDLIMGDAGKVFDLSQEKDDLRDAYGRTTFGQSCLMARRLVERGVPYVTINSKGWDTHKQHFQAMRRKLPDLDKGLATLLVDLSGRGLLDSTIIWCGGEFGRTPKVQWEPPWDGGRGHWGRVFSTLVAGGGFKGGQVVGSSDARGEDVKDRPVYPCDLIASMYELLGIDLQATLPHPQGLKIGVLPGPGDGVKMGGELKEIM
jgi:hypothetical protein